MQIQTDQDKSQNTKRHPRRRMGKTAKDRSRRHRADDAATTKAKDNGN